MKLIPLREFPGLKTAETIKTVISRPAQGATVASMRTGVRVLDAVENNKDPKKLLLEDNDHAALVTAVNGFTFGMVSKDLLTIIEDIISAQAPPAPAAAKPDKPPRADRANKAA